MYKDKLIIVSYIIFYKQVALQDPYNTFTPDTINREYTEVLTCNK